MSKTHFYGRVAAEETFSDDLRRTFTDSQEASSDRRYAQPFELEGCDDHHAPSYCLAALEFSTPRPFFGLSSKSTRANYYTGLNECLKSTFTAA